RMLSLRSSEEQHLKSPLAHHLSDSSTEARRPDYSEVSSTQQPPIYARHARTQSYLRRRPSVLRRKYYGNDLNSRPSVSPYDYPSSRSMMSDSISSPIIGFPAAYRTTEQNKKLRKPFRTTTPVRAEYGRVSANP